MIFPLLVIFSGLSFLVYGVSCLTSQRMQAEFRRFGLERYRPLTGILQLAGASGLFVGLWIPGLGIVGAAGLAGLMLLGLGVRLRIRDGIVQSSPAFLYMVLNAYLSVGFAALA